MGAGRHFYGAENVIWEGFGPVCNTEKEFGRIMHNFRGWFLLMFSWAKKNRFLFGRLKAKKH